MVSVSLPAELWSSICEYLDKRSLRDLFLVSHQFHSTAVPLLFNAVSIRASQAVEFEQLSHRKHVHVLEIRDGLEPTLGHDDAFSHPEAVYGCFPDHQSPQKALAQDTSWTAVDALLRSLPALTDLIWTCPQQFPPRLLRTLRTTTWKLHLRTFRLRSLSGKEPAIDPHELELIRSPNLHSIWAYYDEIIADNNSRLPEIMSYASRGVAPNLRIVRLRQQLIQMTPVREGFQPAEKIRDLESVFPGFEDRHGRLEDFQITGVGPPLNAEQVTAWAGCTDVSVLRTLALESRLEEEALTALAGCKFASLTTLSLHLEIEPGMMSLPENRFEDMTSGPAREFLCSLPPLRKLRLSGEMNHETLHDVLAHHGKRLCTLQLVAGGFSPHRLSLLPEEVRWIGQYCQSLRDLSLQMLRTRGDSNEEAAYASLGSIPSLQTLDLRLDASDYTALRNDENIEPPDDDPGPPFAPILAPAKAHFDAFDLEFSGLDDCGGELLDPRKGHVKDMFINAALDQALVRAIYAKIADAKPPRSLPLDRVEIRSLGGGDFGLSQIQSAIAQVVGALQHKWVVQKDDSPAEGITVTELKIEHSTPGDTDEEKDLDPRVELIFRRLWPPSAAGSKWKNDWHSFQLS